MIFGWFGPRETPEDRGARSGEYFLSTLPDDEELRDNWNASGGDLAFGRNKDQRFARAWRGIVEPKMIERFGDDYG